jgi:hypothetical protein
MTEYNLPVPDDAPWLNLSPEEIEELRKSKRYLTAQATQKTPQDESKTTSREDCRGYDGAHFKT